MIAMLRGTVADRGLDRVVLDVGGVGYLVHGPASALAALPAEGTVVLHVTTVVREDAITLYGFPSLLARDSFEVLREVNGVGPKLALAVLSSLSPGALAVAVEKDDLATLVRVPGIGKKTASRLCLELKGKVPVGFSPDAAPMPPATPRKPPDPLTLALAQLDYRKSDIDRALADGSVPGVDDASLEDRLRAALRVLARPS